MLCRLCLSEAKNLLSIFNESNESEIAKIITKYFYIELNINDEQLSNKICAVCWEHLNTFHRFWLSIEEKQAALLPTLLKVDPFETQEEDEIAARENDLRSTFAKSSTSPKRDELAELEDIKDVILCEPQIDAPLADEILPGGEEVLEFEAAKDFSSINDGEEEEDSHELKKLSKRKCVKVNVKKLSTKCKKNTAHTSKHKSITKSKKTTTKNNAKAKKTLSDETKKPSTESIQELDDFIAASAVLSCCLCKLPLQNFTELLKHFRQVHHCRGYVPCCNSNFTRRVTYVDHLKLHQNPDYFKCHLCNKVLASRNSHVNHMATSHPTEEELKFQCEFCPRKFARQYILDYHAKTHCNERSVHVCDICEKGYRTAYDLKMHKERVHQNKFAAVCDICGKNMRNKYNLLVHKEDVHHEIVVPELQCEICKNWLKNGRTLAKHMLKHRDEASGQKFICPECGVESKTRHSLASHVRYHHTLKPIPCSVCGKEFKRPRCLKEHMATHTGKDLYSCEFCAQTFKSHANYHNHKKKMHPNEWVRKFSQPRRPANLNINETTNIQSK